MVYQFKQGSFIKADAQTAGEMCESLAENGNLTAKALLDANRDENAPLHNAFEWNDGVAAELYREGQARHIISCLCVVREDKEPVRAYFNIVRDEPNYQHIDAILQRQDDTDRLMQTALGELRAFERKYSQLEQLQPVFTAIGEVST